MSNNPETVPYRTEHPRVSFNGWHEMAFAAPDNLLMWMQYNCAEVAATEKDGVKETVLQPQGKGDNLYVTTSENMATGAQSWTVMRVGQTEVEKNEASSEYEAMNIGEPIVVEAFKLQRSEGMFEKPQLYTPRHFVKNPEKQNEMKRNMDRIQWEATYPGITLL